MASVVRGDDDFDSGFFARQIVDYTSAGRVLGQPYTNNKPYPIEVCINDDGINGGVLSITISGVGDTVTFRAGGGGDTGRRALTRTIPSGATYTVALTNGTVEHWSELE